MTAPDTDVLVVGAGVIGLAVGRRLAAAGLRTLVVERNADFGRETSSRNSACIHAGIYYGSGSLKAALCRRGRDLLYAWCDRHGIAARRTGKLIIASESGGLARLEATLAQGQANGIEGLRLLDRAEIGRIEPALACWGAVHSPDSGVLDAHGYMLSLLGAGQAAGMELVTRTPVIAAEPVAGGWAVHTGGDDPTTVTARLVVNAAGLGAIALAHAVFPGRPVPVLHPGKGCYLRYDKPSPLRHIVYPDIVPGVIAERADATPDVHGVLRFGPSVEATNGPDDVALVDGLAERMAPAIRRYLPDLDAGRLVPDFAGVRPKIFGPGEPPADFRVEWAPEPGWLDLWGMESPALTASLAIADHVAELAAAAGFIAAKGIA